MEKHIIIDVATKDDRSLRERLSCEFGLIVHLGEDLTSDMLRIFNQAFGDLGRNTTILIFPGNGANIVKRYLPVNWLFQWKNVSILAKRVWQPGEDPRVFVGRVADQMILGIKQVIIIDDVVSSGKTIRNIRLLNDPWIPGTNWNAVAWLIQDKNSSRGFGNIFGLRVGEKDRLVPINSLSTLMENKKILRSYAERNFSRPKDFISLIEGLY